MSATLPSGDGRIAVWIAVCAALVYLPFSHGHLTGSDEYSIYASTASLVEEGDLAVGRGLHRFAGRNGRWYSIFAVGQSLLAVPFYLVGSAVEDSVSAEALARVLGRTSENAIDTLENARIFAVSLYAPLVSALLVALFYLFERRLGASCRSALLATALLGGTTYVALMSMYFLRHTTETLAVVGALYALCGWRRSGRLRALAIGCLLASLTVLIRVPSAVSGIALAGYLIFSIRERAGEPGSLPPWPRLVLAVALPVMAVAALHVGVNQWKWGTWIGSPMLDQSRAFSTPIHVGVAGLLFAPGSSLFVYSPLLLLLPWTLPTFLRRHRAEAWTLLAVAGSVLLLSSGFQLWHGLWSSPGPRMIFIVVPLLMLPLGPWLDRPAGRGRAWAVASLALLGAAAQLGLLLARWRTVVEVMDYRSYEPFGTFLWTPGLSPVLGAWRVVAQGGIDTWLGSLVTGVPGREPFPTFAGALLMVWALAFGAALLQLRRSVRG